jgi:hypothetical protein
MTPSTDTLVPEQLWLAIQPLLPPTTPLRRPPAHRRPRCPGRHRLRTAHRPVAAAAHPPVRLWQPGHLLAAAARLAARRCLAAAAPPAVAPSPCAPSTSGPGWSRSAAAGPAGTPSTGWTTRGSQARPRSFPNYKTSRSVMSSLWSWVRRSAPGQIVGAGPADAGGHRGPVELGSGCSSRSTSRPPACSTGSGAPTHRCCRRGCCTRSPPAPATS